MHSSPNHASYQEPFDFKVHHKLLACAYDKLQGISNKPMSPTLIARHNQ
jgi:hypothetical protein